MVVNARSLRFVLWGLYFEVCAFIVGDVSLKDCPWLNRGMTRREVACETFYGSETMMTRQIAECLITAWPIFISCETTSIWLLNGDKPCDLNLHPRAAHPWEINDRWLETNHRADSWQVVAVGQLRRHLAPNRNTDYALWHAELSENRVQVCTVWRERFHRIMRDVGKSGPAANKKVEVFINVRSRQLPRCWMHELFQ